MMKYLYSRNIDILFHKLQIISRIPLQIILQTSGRLHPAVCSRLIPSYFFGIDYLTFFLFSVMFYLSPAEWLGAAIEGFASQLKFFGAGVKSRVVKTLLHFCNPLITLTFEQVLCSGSRSYESMQRCISSKQIHINVPAQL